MAARDIQFVIKAQDQASQAFQGIAAALEQLMTAQGSLSGSTEGVNSDLTDLLATLSGFDKVASTVESSSDRASAAYDKQSAKITELRSQLNALEAQRIASVRAEASVNAAGSATGQNDAAAAKIQAITAARAQLAKSITNTTAQLTREEATLKSLGTQYQRVASIANTVGQAKPMVGQLGAGGFFGPGGAAALGNEAIALTKFGQAATTNARAITEVMVMAREASRDNFSRMAGSFSILLNALGLMKASFLVPFAGIAAAIGGIVVAIVQVEDESERLRKLKAILDASADGAKYNAKALAENVDQLRAYGIAAADAMSVVEEFRKAGVNQADFVMLGQAAKNSVKVHPDQFKDVKDAGKQLAEAFTGGYDAIAKLDDATNFLDATERNHLRTMIEEGHGAEARTRALDDYYAKQSAAAKDMRGSWSDAADHLADAWAHLGEVLNKTTFVSELKSAFDKFATGIDGLATLVEGKGKQHSMIQLGFKIEEAEQMRQDPSLQADLKADPTLKSRNGAAAQEYKQVLADILKLRKEIAAYDKQSGASTAGAGKVDPKLAATEAAKKAVDAAQHELDLQRQLANATTSYDRIRVAGEQALKKARDENASEQVAQIKKLEAELGVRKEIERTAVATFTKNIVGAEGGPGQNPFSRAKGYGQFVPGTYLEEYKKAFGGNNGLDKAGILATRTNKDIATVVIEQQAQDLAAALKGFRENVTATNLYMAHFLGAAGAKKVLDANPNTPVDQLGLGAKALSGNQGYLRTANGKGRYRTAGELQQFIGNKIGDTTDDQGAAERTAIDDLIKKQTEFNRALDDENNKRSISLKYLKEELGATADQKYAADRQKAIDEALESARAKAEKAGTVVSPARTTEITNSVGNQYDAEHAEKLVNDRITEQQTLRDALLKAIASNEKDGDTATVQSLSEALKETDAPFQAAIDKARVFWSQFNSPEAKAALQHLKDLQDSIDDTAAQIAKIHLDEINSQIGGATSLQGALQTNIGDQQKLGNSAGAKQSEADLAAINVQLVQLRQNYIDSLQAALAFDDGQLKTAGYTRDGIKATILEQKQAQQQSALMARQFLQDGKQINEMITDDLISGFDNFLQSVEQGKNVWRSLLTAVGETAASILKSLGEMILKQALFNAISGKSAGGQGGIGGSIATAAAKLFPAAATTQTAGNTLITASTQWNATAAQILAAAQALQAANQGGGGGGGGGGGFGSGILGSLFGGAGSSLGAAGGLDFSALLGGGGAAFGAEGLGSAFAAGGTAAAAGGLDFASMLAFAHNGGIAGLATMFRSGVSSAVFAGAARMHTGGMAGLQPDEVPTILQKGEEVLTASNPRHRNNAGKGGPNAPANPGVKQVLLFDKKDIAGAMADSEGRDVMLTHLRTNRRQINAILQGNG